MSENNFDKATMIGFNQWIHVLTAVIIITVGTLFYRTTGCTDHQDGNNNVVTDEKTTKRSWFHRESTPKQATLPTTPSITQRQSTQKQVSYLISVS